MRLQPSFCHRWLARNGMDANRNVAFGFILTLCRPYLVGCRSVKSLQLVCRCVYGPECWRSDGPSAQGPSREKISDVIQTKEVVMARVVQALGNVSFSLRRAESWSVVQALPTNTCVCIYTYIYIYIDTYIYGMHTSIVCLSVCLSIDPSICLLWPIKNQKRSPQLFFWLRECRWPRFFPL